MSGLYRYIKDSSNFVAEEAGNNRLLYFPLCGTSSGAIKSSITPYLSGDIKLDKNHFVTKPVSREDLRNRVRDCFVHVQGKGIVSLAGDHNGSEFYVEAGQLWHKLVRTFKKEGLELQALNFIPVTSGKVELMRVTIKNISRKPLKITPTASIALFGRALANKHDHEHVTALLHRIEQLEQGVYLEHVITFNEEGHRSNNLGYFVFGADDQGGWPVGSFPTFESYLGDAGSADRPQAVYENLAPKKLSPEQLNGKEAYGALRFKTVSLSPGKTKNYYLIIGAVQDKDDALKLAKRFSYGHFEKALDENKTYWNEKAKAISFQTGEPEFDSWMSWVALQPVLRRIFGCSFLPDHDYGKGGKGWRDIWQDLLSLIFIEPENVRERIIEYFAGVRIDGTNATIVGSKPGEFLADRNAITRVWMDHGLWPFLTTMLYVHQTGEHQVLLEKISYFRDPQIFRTFYKDQTWSAEQGQRLLDRQGRGYDGTILEHILIQHLVQFFNVGKHNIIRLENADWNDALDMAFHSGESVAFSSFYAGNLLSLADVLEFLSNEKHLKELLLAKEILVLLDTVSGKNVNYQSAEEKKKLLFEVYFPSVQPSVSGEQISVSVDDIVQDLRKKGEWIFAHIRSQEKVQAQAGQKTYTWFNGYYDNNGQKVEGQKENHVRMTLTGQVFAVMSGLAQPEEVNEVIASVGQFLTDKKLKGIRLNTDFGLRRYLDLGRGFSFAFGTKENGAFFSHMNVMYAYALYKRGFVREARTVIRTIFQMSRDTKRSKIYPGIPEYFDSLGQGMYHYLTGSASWMILTQLTQCFGVCGEYGDLVLSPKLTKEDFNRAGRATVSCSFASKRLVVTYINKDKLDAGKYKVKEILLNGRPTPFISMAPDKVKFKRNELIAWPKDSRLDVIFV